MGYEKGDSKSDSLLLNLFYDDEILKIQENIYINKKLFGFPLLPLLSKYYLMKNIILCDDFRRN